MIAAGDTSAWQARTEACLGSRGELVETNQLGEPMVTMQLGMLPNFKLTRARVKKLSRVIARETDNQARLGQPLH